MKRKRSRMSVSIYQKFHESPISSVLENSIDNEIQSSFSKKRLETKKGDSENSILKGHLMTRHKKRTFKSEEKMKSELELDDSTATSLNLIYFPNRNNKSGAKKKQNVYVKHTLTANENPEIKYKENLSEVTDKTRYCKRKFPDETITEGKIEKKNKLIDVEPKKNSNINQSCGSISKLKNSIHSKRSSNLLNYFSRSTSQQLEKDRLKGTTVTIKAEIHNTQDFQATHLLDKSIKTKNFKPQELSSKKLMEEYNEICLIQSETIILSPMDKKIQPSLQQSKPKWSLKIQLQSNNSKGSDTDDEIYMPTSSPAQLNENTKNHRDFPKILLPIKNSKIGWNKSSSLFEGNKEKSNKNLEDNLKTEFEENKTPLTENSGIDSNFKTKTNNGFCTEKEVKINIDKSDIPKKTTTGKLAPLFLKKVKPSAETVSAKHLFLQSKINNYTDNSETKNFELIQKSLPFPKISHVNQITQNIDKTKASILIKTYNFSEKEVFQSSFNFPINNTVSKLKTDNLIAGVIYESTRANIDFVLVELKTYYSDIQSLWENISKVSKSKSVETIEVEAKQMENSIRLNDFPQASYLWTEKYKPNNSYEVIGNEAAVSKLKIWLQNWQSLKTNENYSSGEEFYVSDSSSSSDANSNKVAVLIGPHGSGKTASVYAVAQELEYMVLEVNASSKRPGKKILKDFEEATKSHRVKNFDTENVFAISSCNTDKNDRISKKSLIFMEDVDLLFEEDDGFVSAVFQLASCTKRPIVMTLRSSCFYLSKMAPRQLQINFVPVMGKKVIALLQLIALAETGYQLSHSCVDALYQDGDLRKSLLQMQYLLMSGSERILHTSLAVSDLSWHDVGIYIYNQAIKADEIYGKEEFQNPKIINSLVKSLDNFTLMSNLMNIKDPTRTSINIKYEPCTSLTQNSLPYCSLDSVSLEIGNWINNSLKNSVPHISREKTNQPNNKKNSQQTLSEEQQIIHINSTLSKIAFYSLDHQSLTVDYLPSIRNICRAEKMRYQSNTKRGNRFFHYLQNSRHLTENMRSCNIFSAACKMLQEKDRNPSQVL